MRAALLCLILADTLQAAVWTHAATPHFDIYSNSEPAAARSLALSFERLHAFFVRQAGIAPRTHREVRVICFATAQEYNLYRTGPGADAYFIGAESRDYIVLPAAGRGDLRVAAHEYAHVLIHSGGWMLPDWISEGMGDVISTVQFHDRDTRIGGSLPDRVQTLRNVPWMSLPDLFAHSLKPEPATPNSRALFYAQSWALADLLMLSPTYSAAFPTLLAALASGVPAQRALETVYHTTLDAIGADLRGRQSRPVPDLPLPSTAGAATEVRSDSVSPFAARVLLADLRFANGELAAADSAFRELAREQPAAAEVQGALGAIALRRGDNAGALAAWKRALDSGITDPDLCYRFAVLADERGLPARDALLRAIELRPDFDDARFKLALLEKNDGHAETAIAHFRAMRQVPHTRAYAYWSALSDALLDLDRRAEARQAAVQAQTHAATPAELSRAAELIWLADTQLAVEIDGQKFRTVRVPIAAPARNPFVEANDRARQVEATLRQVDCPESGIQLIVDTAQGQLPLAIPDPSRVQIRNASAESFEFVCGPQPPRKVLVEYRPAGNILRGLEFK